jgi:hypothetical protein
VRNSVDGNEICRQDSSALLFGLQFSVAAHLGVAMKIWAGDALRHCRHRVARFLRLRTVVAHRRCHLDSHLAQWVRGFRLRAGSS